MIIEQLSIFLNNSLGRLSEVTGVLGNDGINMKAFTLSESSDFGLLKIITDDTAKALSVLKRHGFAVSSSKVVLIDLEGDTPGSLSIILKRISDLGISVESMYAFSTFDGAKAVIQTDDIERCNKTLMK